jgi:hypothetical protein
VTVTVMSPEPQVRASKMLGTLVSRTELEREMRHVARR